MLFLENIIFSPSLLYAYPIFLTQTKKTHNKYGTTFLTKGEMKNGYIKSCRNLEKIV